LICAERLVHAIDVCSYGDLLNVLRGRKAELGASFETIDVTSGLPAGYSQKLLGKTPVKRLGEISLGALLGCLGLKLVAVEDPVALARVERRLRARQLRHAVVHKRVAAAADSISASPAI
jgi:hypothetical protein